MNLLRTTRQLSTDTSITPAVDGNNNPIANTYDIVVRDGSSSITATGVRSINPADGSYTDALLSSATAANPDGVLTARSISVDCGIISGNEFSSFSRSHLKTLELNCFEKWPVNDWSWRQAI